MTSLRQIQVRGLEDPSNSNSGGALEIFAASEQDRQINSVTANIQRKEQCHFHHIVECDLFSVSGLINSLIPKTVTSDSILTCSQSCNPLW